MSHDKHTATHVFCSLATDYIVEREHNFLNIHVFSKQYKVMHLRVPLQTENVIQI